MYVETEGTEKTVSCQSYHWDFIGITMPEQDFKSEGEFPASYI